MVIDNAREEPLAKRVSPRGKVRGGGPTFAIELKKQRRKWTPVLKEFTKICLKWTSRWRWGGVGVLMMNLILGSHLKNISDVHRICAMGYWVSSKCI